MLGATYLFAAVFALGAAVFPQAGRVELRGPQPATVRPGEPAAVELRFHGNTAAELLELPRVAGLRMQAGAPTRFESSSYVNGRVTRDVATTWTIQLVANRAGVFQVPAFRVRVGKTLHKARGFKLRCVAAIEGATRAFLECGVIPKQVFVHQPLDVWIRVGVDVALFERMQRIRPQQPNVYGLFVDCPWWDKFPAGLPAEPDPTRLPSDQPLLPINRSLRIAASLGQKERDHRTFQVFELRRRFIPHKAGTFALPGPTMQFEWVTGYRDGGFLMGRVAVKRSVYAASPATSLSVLPLPKEGRPAGFGNAVGRFRLSADLARSSLKVGESVQLTLRITGNGNFEFLELPKLTDWRDFHLFGTKVERSATGVTVVYDLAALADSVSEVPAIHFSYFDVVAKPPEYKIVSTAPIPIKVAAIPGGKGLDPLPNSGKALTAGIDDIWDRLPVEGEAPRPFRPEPWLVWLAMLAPFVLFGGGVWFVRRQGFLRDNPHVVRSRRARERFDARMASDGTLRSFSLFVAERLGWDEGAAVSPDLRERLVAHGVADELADRVVGLMVRLTESRYAGGSAEAQHADEARRLVEELDREVRT